MNLQKETLKLILQEEERNLNITKQFLAQVENGMKNIENSIKDIKEKIKNLEPDS